MKKGWIRVHIILSVVFWLLAFTVYFPSKSSKHFNGYYEHYTLLIGGLPIYWGVLYLTIFLIKWLKEGFKEDAEKTSEPYEYRSLKIDTKEDKYKSWINWIKKVFQQLITKIRLLFLQ